MSPTKKATTTKAVSLKDIAEKAGVSVPTVSKVLRDKGEVSDVVRQRIKQIAQDLNWRRNLLVEGFQTGKTHLIGVIINPRTSFNSEMIQGIHAVLNKHNYAPILLWPAKIDERPTEIDQLNRLLEYRVDGILIIPCLMKIEDEYLQQAWKEEVPIVCIDAHMHNTHADYVGSDTETGGKQVADYLLKKGHTHFAHYAGPPYSISVSKRSKGFENSITQAGCECYTFLDNSFGNEQKNADIFLDHLQDNPKITAIFADNDYQAIAIYRAAAKRGLHIPKDLSIVGFGNTPEGKNLFPPLTTVNQNSYDMGVTATKQLLNRIQKSKRSNKPKHTILPVELIKRESVLDKKSNPEV